MTRETLIQPTTAGASGAWRIHCRAEFQDHEQQAHDGGSRGYQYGPEAHAGGVGDGFAEHSSTQANRASVPQSAVNPS